MKLTTEKLKELLVKPGHIERVDFDDAVNEAEQEKVPIERFLIKNGFIKDENLGQTIANAFDYRFLDLTKEKVDDEVFSLIPELVSRSREVIAVTRGKDGIKVGMRNPDDLETRHFIEKRLGESFNAFYITERGFETALLNYKRSLREEFTRVLEKLQDTALSREDRDEITVHMIDTLLQYGYDNKASDIHIEPHRKKLVVRFRIDGVMHDVLDMPVKLSDLILTRIKILAKMRTDEHRAAQDGKFQFRSKEEDIDVRVSIAPVTGGENTVMRLLAAKARQFSLIELGLSENDLSKVENSIKKPHGMILVTGPTGSGKTTTVYSVMQILNKRDVHISTIEDPVEYDIEGVSQIQVNEKTNLSFAKGLRAIVRQDPDIIMVGEIRDEETADIAINSGMTGHLVLSTLHANDVATTFPRLLDMGVEPFLVASTVNIAIAQRLVRKICEKCRVSYELTDEEKKFFKEEPGLESVFIKKNKDKLSGIRLYKGSGCKVCGDTGFTGRIGIFEVLEMGDNIKALIIKRSSSDEIMKVARTNGMTTMLENGIDKALQGITTLNEVIRVIKM